MLLPISDDDRKLSGPAYVTLLLILANLGVFFFAQDGGTNTTFNSGWSVVPHEILTGEDLKVPQDVLIDGVPYRIPQAPGPRPIFLTLITALFMHQGYIHLLGNLLYLWIFGDNVEHRFGSHVFLSFYLVSGIAATMAQIALDPYGVIPILGASGAISGVLGAYLVLFPRNRVHAIFMFFFVVSIPAFVAIGFWIVMQFLMGIDTFFGSVGSGGVAYGAHIGGFAAGVIMALILRVMVREERPSVLTRHVETTRLYW